MASKRSASRRAGFTMIEGLVACMIMSVAMAGVFSLWAGMFRKTGTARTGTLAAQLVRAEIERAKVFGVPNLPLGNYSSSAKVGIWVGSYDQTQNSGNGGWVANSYAYYDGLGNRLSSSAGAVIRTQDTLVDSDVLTYSGGYSFRLPSRRTFSVTATDMTNNNSTIFTAGTVIVSGGL